MADQEPAQQERPQPICTIAIPVFNREELVRGAIESALQHPQENLEILVIDNCSTDKTVEVARQYNDPRLRVVQNESNLGLFGNFNRCLELASGKYVCILCSDDRHRPGFLDAALPVMEENSGVGLLTTHQRTIDPQGQQLRTSADHLQPGVYDGKEAIRAFLWFQSHYAFNVFNLPSGCLFRTEFVRRIKGFPNDWQIVGDVEFYLRLLEVSDLAALDVLGVDVIFHPGQEVFLKYGDPTRVHEHFALIDRYKELLGPAKYRRAIAQTVATTMALAFKFRFLKDREASRLHWDLVYSRAKSIGLGPFGRWIAFMRLIALRGLFKVFKTRNLPYHPKKALGGSNDA